MKKLILILAFFAFLTLSKNANGQNHYFYPTVINSSGCNVAVSFLDGSFNVIYTNSFAPGTTLVGCVSGTCAWIKYESIVSCSKIITCSPGAIDNSYITTCGNCCSMPCLPFNTAEIPGGTFQTYTNTGSFPYNKCGVTGDLYDDFILQLY